MIMKVSKEEIRSYIPHGEPFIMIDNLIEATSDRFVTNFTILPSNIFLHADRLEAYGLIENIAQSAAVGINYLKTDLAAKPVAGFIAAVTKLKLYGLPKVNDEIYTIVTPLHQYAKMHLVRGENLVDGKLVLECEIKLAGI
jgi:3-hydroxyacyl-[acyl-carrier-protein] dehydratase